MTNMPNNANSGALSITDGTRAVGNDGQIKRSNSPNMTEVTKSAAIAK
jgi:hypothetical protein